MTRHAILATLLTLGLASFGLGPAAALGEDCTISLSLFAASATCTGTFPESAHLTWCPNEPWIDCKNVHITTCYVGTSSPWVCTWSSLVSPALP